MRGSNAQATSSPRNNPYSEKPSPYEVWHQKNKDKFAKKKPVAKLNGQQWDNLVEKMHQSNRVKQSAMIKEQNQGLAAELEGFSFKPRINKTSMDLSATMKSLNLRIPDMIAESKKMLETKRKESAEQEVAECSFKPKRNGAKNSDMYLKKLGREKMVPEDLIRYEAERARRNEVRKQIVDEIEERNLTFKPQLGEKSIKLQEKLLQRGVIDVDPLTRTTVPASPGPGSAMFSPSTSKRRHNNPLGIPMGLGLAGHGEDAVQFVEGPLLQIESEHPYKHNTNEYTTVQVPGAVSYSIRFTEETRTEAIYDFVKFYDNETHTEYFGSGKYSGGTNGSSCNWPGVGHRPPLIIPASKFIIHFKTNGSVNDWGFRMQIVPTLSSHMRKQQLANAGIPVITNAGRNYSSPTGGNIAASRSFFPDDTNNNNNNTTMNMNNNNGTTPRAVPVHVRLYQEAVEKATEHHNAQVDLMQNKLNISLKPWENVRSAEGKHGAAHKFIRLNSSTHLPKNTLSSVADSLVVNGSDANASQRDEGGSVFSFANQNGLDAQVPPTVVEFDDTLGALWKQLRL